MMVKYKVKVNGTLLANDYLYIAHSFDKEK